MFSKQNKQKKNLKYTRDYEKNQSIYLNYVSWYY